MKLKTLIGCAAGVAIVAGCATTPKTQPASEQEIATAKASYMSCLLPYVRNFDDGVSDAKTIASALVGECADRYAAVVEASCRHCNAAVRRGLLHRREQIQLDIATQAVLHTRVAEMDK